MKTQDALNLLIALEERAARIYLESSELDVLGHRVVQSVRTEVPEGAERLFAATDALCQRLAVAAEKVSDPRLRHRLEAMLAGTKGR